MHYMDADKLYSEKGKAYGEKLHKNTTSYTEQILEATSHKKALYGHWPPIYKSIQIRWTRHVRHCWRSKDNLISEDWLEAMNDRDEWWVGNDDNDCISCSWVSHLIK